MKIAIATPEQAGYGWIPLVTDFKTPAEIYAMIKGYSDIEDSHPGYQHRLVTMNQTVLDLCDCVDNGHNFFFDHGDVLLYVEGKGLIPLMYIHTNEFLAHSKLGTLWKQGALGKVR